MDNFLTSDPTEEQITDWIKSICHVLAEVPLYTELLTSAQALHRPDLETTCNLILAAEVPNWIGDLKFILFSNVCITDQIVEQNLDPETICKSLGVCT